MANKTKAWRAAGKANTIDGRFTARQIVAFRRHQMAFPSQLLMNMLERGGYYNIEVQ